MFVVVGNIADIDPLFCNTQPKQLIVIRQIKPEAIDVAYRVGIIPE